MTALEGKDAETDDEMMIMALVGAYGEVCAMESKHDGLEGNDAEIAYEMVHQAVRKRLATPAPATEEVERIMGLVDVYANAGITAQIAHSSGTTMDAVSVTSAYDALRAAVGAALAAPVPALVVPEDVATLAFRHGRLRRERWMAVLKAENPDDNTSRSGWGETANDALAAARAARDGGAS